MIEYTTIRIYTSEKARYEGKELSQAVVSYIHSLKIAARCIVMRGAAGCYENGETATSHIVELSFNLPIIIEIVVPAQDSHEILAKLETMVVDGIVGVLPMSIFSFHSFSGLLPKNLRVRDVMTPKPSIAHPDFSVRAIVEMLLDTGLKALPVADIDGMCVGIITQNDLMVRARMPVRLGLLTLLPKSEREDWLTKGEQVRCADVMTNKPDVVHEHTKLAEAIHLMNRERRKRLPVIDTRGMIVGMLSRIDVLKAIATARSTPSHSSDLPHMVTHPHFVRDIESRDTFSLAVDMSIQAAIDALVREGSQRAAVVDEKGKLVGLISDDMLLNAIGGRIPRKFPFGFSHRSRAGFYSVSSIMKRDVKTIREDATIDEAIRLMTELGLKRIPIVGADGAFRGMVRRDSILFSLAHTY